MSAEAWISLVCAVVSVLSLLATVGFAILAGRSASRAESITMGEAETSLRSAISSTRQRVEDLSVQIGVALDGKRPDEFTAKDRRRLETLEKAFRSAVEDNLNAYEDACAKYVDRKIDTERFKKSYVSEIQRLCAEKTSVITDLMHPDTTSKFQAIWKVYREWHIHEK